MCEGVCVLVIALAFVFAANHRGLLCARLIASRSFDMRLGLKFVATQAGSLLSFARALCSTPKLCGANADEDADVEKLTLKRTSSNLARKDRRRRATARTAQTIRHVQSETHWQTLLGRQTNDELKKRAEGREKGKKSPLI